MFWKKGKRRLGKVASFFCGVAIQSQQKDGTKGGRLGEVMRVAVTRQQTRQGDGGRDEVTVNLRGGLGGIVWDWKLIVNYWIGSGKHWRL